MISQSKRLSISRHSNKWNLHIKNVKKSDKGWYMCQLNTNKMMTRTAFLDVRKVEDDFDTLLQKCMEDYLQEAIEQGIHTINQDHILECCNGTSVNNCLLRKGKTIPCFKYFLVLYFILSYNNYT